MSNKARRWTMLGLVACSLACLLGVWFIATRPSPELELFDRIEEGMDIEQVKELFPGRQPNHGGALVPGRGDRKFVCYNWWLSDYVISVVVDADGRVIHKRLLDYEDEPFLNRVRRWVGLNNEPRVAVRREID